METNVETEAASRATITRTRLPVIAGAIAGPLWFTGALLLFGGLCAWIAHSLGGAPMQLLADFFNGSSVIAWWDSPAGFTVAIGLAAAAGLAFIVLGVFLEALMLRIARAARPFASAWLSAAVVISLVVVVGGIAGVAAAARGGEVIAPNVGLYLLGILLGGSIVVGALVSWGTVFALSSWTTAEPGAESAAAEPGAESAAAEPGDESAASAQVNEMEAEIDDEASHADSVAIADAAKEQASEPGVGAERTPSAPLVLFDSRVTNPARVHDLDLFEQASNRPHSAPSSSRGNGDANL
ncbi:hypothetical protein [Humidisolicoccus flavus]|uniref:hypothetical protein n=1 Tax=Humidisolicoccus flavus TaxID=3111414 RepID=UPI003245D2C2